MKALFLAAAAAVALSGCVAVPAGPYYGDAGYYGGSAGYYYPAPSVSIGAYYGPGYYGHRHRYRRW
jgi:hypothetical protein